MSGRRGRSTGALALIAALLLAGGCSGDAAPIVTETPTPSVSPNSTASPTPTPSPSATELSEEEVIEAIPPLARQEDLTAASAFSRYFVELYPRIFESERDALLFAEFSDAECAFCESSIETATQAREAKIVTEGGDVSWGDLVTSPSGGLNDDGFWYVTQPATFADTVMQSPDGAEPRSSAGGSAKVTTKLSYESERWTVHGVNIEFDDE